MVEKMKFLFPSDLMAAKLGIILPPKENMNC